MASDFIPRGKIAQMLQIELLERGTMGYWRTRTDRDNLRKLKKHPSINFQKHYSPCLFLSETSANFANVNIFRFGSHELFQEIELPNVSAVCQKNPHNGLQIMHRTWYGATKWNALESKALFILFGLVPFSLRVTFTESGTYHFALFRKLPISTWNWNLPQKMPRRLRNRLETRRLNARRSLKSTSRRCRPKLRKKWRRWKSPMRARWQRWRKKAIRFVFYVRHLQPCIASYTPHIPLWSWAAFTHLCTDA